MKSFITFVIIATVSISLTLSVTGIGLTVIPISTGVTCGLKISNKVVYETVMQRFNKHEKPFERAQQTINSFDDIHRKCSQDNAIDIKEYESLCNILQNTPVRIKTIPFLANIKL